MTAPKSANQAPAPRSRKRTVSGKPLKAVVEQPINAAVMQDAEAAGLLAGGKTAHVSFRAPAALVQAAKETTGVTSTSELGMLALATLARRDPVASFFKRTHGRLGPDHDLDY